MKQLLKLSILLLLVALAFCACDKNDGDDDRKCVYPNPSQPSESIYNYTGEVEFVVDAPQIKEKIEQDLTENPPFGGAKKYKILMRKVSSALAATFTLNAQDTRDETSFYSYRMILVGDAEWKENYKLFPVGSGISDSWNKWDIVPIASGDGKAIATYDVFIKQDIPAPWLAVKCIFVRTSRRNFARSSLKTTSMLWFAVWFFRMSRVGMLSRISACITSFYIMAGMLFTASLSYTAANR